MNQQMPVSETGALTAWRHPNKMAGIGRLEHPRAVLETAVLPLELRPCRSEAHYIDEIVLCKGANQASFFKVEFQKKFKKNYFINQCDFKSRYFSAYILRV